MSKIAEHDPQKVSLERPLLHIFWKKVHHKNRNEKLGKVAKFQVFISNNECAANRKPQGGPIRPPPRTGIGLKIKQKSRSKKVAVILRHKTWVRNAFFTTWKNSFSVKSNKLCHQNLLLKILAREIKTKRGSAAEASR